MEAKVLATLVTFLIFHLCLSLNDSVHGTPNIIIFLTDNLSMKDLGFYNNNSQETPNLDSLVEEGVVFSRFYGQSSRIASLASLLTGLLPPRTGIIKSKFLNFEEIPSLASSGGLQHSEITLAEDLKAKGYTTSFVGLWGLGVGRNAEYLPLNHGFDSWYGVASANKEPCMESYKTTSDSVYTWQSVCAFFSPLLYILPFVGFIGWYNGLGKIVTVFIVIIAFILYSSILHDVIHFTMDFIQVRSCVLYRNSNIIEQPYAVENLTLRFTRNAVQFLESSSISSKPFLLFFSFMNLNHPEFASRLFSNSSQDAYFDALKELDWSVGRILRKLKEHDLENNTLVFFTSATGHHFHKTYESCSVADNGGRETSCLQGGSVNRIWEQTIRVPAVMRWKGKLKENQIIKTPVTIMDVVPTVLELLNESAEAMYLDGKSLLPVVLNSSVNSQHKYIFHYLDVTKPAAITSGSYKVVYAEIKAETYSFVNLL
ncbi:steryl-sulfatase-like isoform X2 [Stylophora pistillata]|uniref:steryl-sulfatase-like isoform X2 n=1 Tax=Stylophora pistillata TaxID=50429 RepID=UPI000C05162D|nr:steryl-sulfatase-like isoform X2 [Stylophora pistillata]